VEYGPVELIEVLNKIGGENGIGIVDIVENRLVGIVLTRFLGQPKVST